MKNLIFFFALLFSLTVIAPHQVHAQYAHSIKIDPTQDPDSTYVMMTDTVYSKYRQGKGKFFSTNSRYGLVELHGGKQWLGILAQASTSAPTATIIRNTTSQTMTFARTATGVYTCTLPGHQLTANKVYPNFVIGNATGLVPHVYSITDSTVVIKTFDAAGAAVDLIGTGYLDVFIKP